jgi:hypothetical protein
LKIVDRQTFIALTLSSCSTANRTLGRNRVRLWRRCLHCRAANVDCQILSLVWLQIVRGRTIVPEIAGRGSSCCATLPLIQNSHLHVLFQPIVGVTLADQMLRLYTNDEKWTSVQRATNRSAPFNDLDKQAIFHFASTYCIDMLIAAKLYVSCQDSNRRVREIHDRGPVISPVFLRGSSLTGARVG